MNQLDGMAIIFFIEKLLDVVLLILVWHQNLVASKNQNLSIFWVLITFDPMIFLKMLLSFIREPTEMKELITLISFCLLVLIPRKLEPMSQLKEEFRLPEKLFSQLVRLRKIGRSLELFQRKSAKLCLLTI